MTDQKSPLALILEELEDAVWRVRRLEDPEKIYWALEDPLRLVQHAMRAAKKAYEESEARR